VRGVERGKTLDFFKSSDSPGGCALLRVWPTSQGEPGELKEESCFFFFLRSVLCCAVRWVDKRIAFWSEKTGNLEKWEREGDFFLFFPPFGKVVRILDQKDLRKFSLQATTVVGIALSTFDKVNLETTGSSVY